MQDCIFIVRFEIINILPANISPGRNVRQIARLCLGQDALALEFLLLVDIDSGVVFQGQIHTGFQIQFQCLCKNRCGNRPQAQEE